MLSVFFFLIVKFKVLDKNVFIVAESVVERHRTLVIRRTGSLEKGMGEKRMMMTRRMWRNRRESIGDSECGDDMDCDRDSRSEERPAGWRNIQRRTGRMGEIMRGGDGGQGSVTEDWTRRER